MTISYCKELIFSNNMQLSAADVNFKYNNLIKILLRYYYYYYNEFTM